MHALRREPAVGFLLGSVLLLSLAVAAGKGVLVSAMLVLLVGMIAPTYRSLLRWHSLIGLLVIVILFVPIKRYQLPAALPFDLELYRVVVAALIACWLTSLAIDRHVRLRHTAFDAPLALIVVAVSGSIIANPGRTQSLSSDVAKSLTFLLSYVLVYYMAAGVVRGRRSIDTVVKVLVGGGAIVALFSIYERRTGYNVFDHLHTVARFLVFQGSSAEERGGRLRVLASAQHPIAFGAALAVLVPLSIYLAKSVNRRWWAATIVLVFGVLGTASRTAFVMMVAIGLMYLWLKPALVKRLVPYVIPAVAASHFIVPGAIAGIRDSFSPSGGLIEQQTRLAQNADPLLAGGRIRQIGPQVDLAMRHPVFGQGWGTRLTGFDNPRRNAPILDNQWLGTLVELGIVGTFAWVWLLVRSVRRLARESRHANDPDSWLLAGIAAAVGAFGIGMAFFDAFSFIQATFLFWIVLALGASTLDTVTRSRRRPAHSPRVSHAAH